MEQRDKFTNFVQYICKICEKDKGAAAALRKADLMQANATVFSTLVKFGVDITSDSEYIPYCLVSASIARSKIYENGTLSLGKALLAAEKKPSAADQEKDDSRLRRLLSCDSLKELSLVFRQIISLIQSRQKNSLDYVELLKDLYSFKYEEGRERVKKKWAMQFYSGDTGEKNDN